MSCKITDFNKVDKYSKDKKDLIKIEVYFEKKHYDEIVYWSKRRKIDIGVLLGEAIYDWINITKLEEKGKELERQFKQLKNSSSKINS